MRYLRWFVRLIVFLILIVFALQNTAPITVHLLGLDWHAPLVFVLLLFFIVGAALGVMAGAAWLYRHRREVVQLRRELRQRQGAHEPLLDAAREHRVL